MRQSCSAEEAPAGCHMSLPLRPHNRGGQYLRREKFSVTKLDTMTGSFTSICVHVKILASRVEDLEVHIRLRRSIIRRTKSPDTRSLEARLRQSVSKLDFDTGKETYRSYLGHGLIDISIAGQMAQIPRIGA